MNPITLPLAELKSGLTGLGKIINPKSSLPILQSLRIERTPDGWVCLTATDLDRFVTLRLEQPAKGEPLAMLVPYDDLLRLTKNGGKDEALQLEPGPDKTAIIRFNLGSETGETKVRSLPVDEFPAMPRIQSNAIPVSDALRQALHEAMACSSKDETRLVLQGAFLDVTKPKAHYVVATDGRHLYSSNSFNLPLKHPVIIPRHKFLAWREFNLDGAWQLKVADTAESKDKAAPLVQLSSRRWRFITRQIEGPYPNWRQVVPDSRARTIIELDPNQLEAVIQTIERLPCHDERCHTLGIEWRGGQLFLLGKPQPTDAWTRVPVKAAKGEGPDVTVQMDRQYLIKALQFGLNTLGLIDELSPLRFSRGGRQMIVAPLRHDPHGSNNATPKPAPINGGSPGATSVPDAGPPQPHDKPMPTPTPSQPPTTVPKLDDIIASIHEMRETFLKGVNQLRDLSMRLKEVHRGHRSSQREMQSVRSTLLSLQRMRL